MKLSKITNLDLIKLLESSTELFRNRIYHDKDYVQQYIGLGIHRSGFYGVQTPAGVNSLKRNQTSFNEPNDVVLSIEGVVILPRVPVNTGAGAIVYSGYGVLEVDGAVIYDGRSSSSTPSINDGQGTVWNNVNSSVDLGGNITQDTNIYVDSSSLFNLWFTTSGDQTAVLEKFKTGTSASVFLSTYDDAALTSGAWVGSTVGNSASNAQLGYYNELGYTYLQADSNGLIVFDTLDNKGIRANSSSDISALNWATDNLHYPTIGDIKANIASITNGNGTTWNAVDESVDIGGLLLANTDIELGTNGGSSYSFSITHPGSDFVFGPLEFKINGTDGSLVSKIDADPILNPGLYSRIGQTYNSVQFGVINTSTPGSSLINITPSSITIANALGKKGASYASGSVDNVDWNTDDLVLANIGLIKENVKAPRHLSFSLTGQASGTFGLFSKNSESGAILNPSGKPTTSPYDQYANGGIDPYVITEGGTISQINVALATCAVNTGTVGANPTARFSVYEHDGTTRTLLTNIDVPIPAANVDVFNNLGDPSKFVVMSFDTDIDLSNTTKLIGIEFTNRNSTDEEINAISRCMINLKLEY